MLLNSFVFISTRKQTFKLWRCVDSINPFPLSLVLFMRNVASLKAVC